MASLGTETFLNSLDPGAFKSVLRFQLPDGSNVAYAFYINDPMIGFAAVCATREDGERNYRS